jgi:TonB family protein
MRMPVYQLAKSRSSVWRLVSSGLLVCLLGLSSTVVLSAGAQSDPARLLPGNQGPAYPEAAQAKMIVGDVIFRAQVKEDGSVESVTILKAPEKNIGFEESVRDTVMGWKFEPAKAEGKPVVGVYIGKIGFSLRPDDEKAIQGVVAEAAEYWNKGDAKKLASQFDRSEGRIQGKQDLARSSGEVQDWISSQMSGAYKDAEVKLTLDGIEFFPVADLARIKPRFTMSGVGGDGDEPLRGQFSVLMLKNNGRWTALCGQLISRQGAGGLEAPKKVKEVPPVYPGRAKRDGVQGTVVLAGTVSPDGNVTDVKVLRSVPELDKAAMDAVKEWKYEPAVVDGEPTSMVTTMTVSFTVE